MIDAFWMTGFDIRSEIKFELSCVVLFIHICNRFSIDSTLTKLNHTKKENDKRPLDLIFVRSFVLLISFWLFFRWLVNQEQSIDFLSVSCAVWSSCLIVIDSNAFVVFSFVRSHFTFVHFHWFRWIIIHSRKNKKKRNSNICDVDVHLIISKSNNGYFFYISLVTEQLFSLNQGKNVDFNMNSIENSIRTSRVDRKVIQLSRTSIFIRCRWSNG